MANYSTKQDLLTILPNASGSIIASADYDTTWQSLADTAYAEINSYIGHATATPSSEDLSMVEAHLIAYQALAARFQAPEDQGDHGQGVEWHRTRAYWLLDNHLFPASASTPSQIQDFADSTGTFSITVTVDDEWTYDAAWTARCTSAGGEDAIFTIWNNAEDINYTYDLDNDTQFPTEEHIDGASAKGLIKGIKVVIAGDDSNPFTLGDTWTWRTYSRKKATPDRQFIGSLKIMRS